MLAASQEQCVNALCMHSFCNMVKDMEYGVSVFGGVDKRGPTLSSLAWKEREVDPSGGSGQRQACFCSVLRLGEI